MNKILTAAAAALTLVATGACSSKQQETTADDAPKTLVLYYSQTGATKAVAEELQKALGADIEAIEVEEPYDGSYDETIQRCIAERESGKVPSVKPLQSDLSQYDVIFLGYPVWFGTYARPIAGLIEAYDFEGKTVVPFCTFGSGGIEATTADLRAALPKADIAPGYGVRNARIASAPAEITAFLISNGYIEGDAVTLPDFSEQQPVTELETAIFDVACGDYIFPLGTPVTCGSRQVPGGTEYRYIADSKGPDGQAVQAEVYVIASDTEGIKPEFTRVVR